MRWGHSIRPRSAQQCDRDRLTVRQRYVRREQPLKDALSTRLDSNADQATHMRTHTGPGPCCWCTAAAQGALAGRCSWGGAQGGCPPPPPRVSDVSVFHGVGHAPPFTHQSDPPTTRRMHGQEGAAPLAQSLSPTSGRAGACRSAFCGCPSRSGCVTRALSYVYVCMYTAAAQTHPATNPPLPDPRPTSHTH